MAVEPAPLASYDLADPHLDDAVASLLATLPAPPQILALGEPTHGEPAFPRLRNRVLETLVAHGFRSVAIESDRVAATDVDAYVQGGDASLDVVLASGFSHGLERLDATRELVTWLRAYNEGRPPAQRVAVHGFDAPLEMTFAPSPGPYLRHAHAYLARHLPSTRHADTDLDVLLGDDGRWSDPAALRDATRSVGASPEAVALRAVADDLLTTLYAEAPALVAASSPDEWQRAQVHAATALGLLRYHAQAAEDAPPAVRTSRLLGIRDALMAQNLLDIRTREAHRGPTLVFAHNRHLQRHPSTWRLAGMDLRWWSAGAIVSSLLGERYAVVVGSLGASGALKLGAPPAGTFEAALDAALDAGDHAPGGRVAVVDPVRLRQAGPLRARTDVTPEQGHFPLDEETVAHCDAILHVTAPGAAGAEPAAASDPRPVAVVADRPAPLDPADAAAATPSAEAADRLPAGPTADDLAERILTLPEVALVVADEASGAPEVAWGWRFFYVGPDRRMPFATIGESDMAGFDEESRLHRPGVFRLNLDLGRREFARVLGYPPARFADHRTSVDFTALDEVIPNPLYGAAGWVSVLNPGPRSLAEVERLIAYAHDRALDRHRRRSDRGHPNA
ncbi:DUF6194 family protein [Micromonospora globbae]|uniref:DUF6194 family protein n=1 Tax=Micromonospora globbae TaxID=1894969 RepID=UPI003426E750